MSVVRLRHGKQIIRVTSVTKSVYDLYKYLPFVSMTSRVKGTKTGLVIKYMNSLYVEF